MADQNNLPLRAIIHEEGGGYWAEVPELPGCYTQADTLDELLGNLREAVSLYSTDTSVPSKPNLRLGLLEIAA
jgi:predicted RNase H-like HicB family nuclease